MSSRMREFTCKGVGTQPTVTFTPTQVDCGPILPKFDGQVPNEARLQMVNPCPYPIEVVSLDFDKRYLADDEVLRGVDEKRYNEAGVMYQVPLQPGEALWPELVSEAAQRKQMAEASTAQDAAAAAAGGAGAEGGAATEAAEGVGELEAVPSAPAVLPPARVVVVVQGAALSGCSTQARLLGERYSVPVATFDDLLFEGADVEAPAPTPAFKEGEDSAAAAVDSTSAAAGETAATAASEAEKADEAAEAPETPPYFDAEISDLLYDKVLIDPELESKPGFVAPHTKLAAKELQELLLRGLKQALLARGFGPAGEPGAAPSRFHAGFVLDSLASKYCTADVAVRLLMEALGMTPTFTEAPVEAPPEPAGKGKPKPKDAAPPPPPVMEGWAGPHDVYFVNLDASAELLKERLRTKRQEEEEEARRAAEEAARAAPVEQEEAEQATEGMRPASAAAASTAGGEVGASGAEEATAATTQEELEAKAAEEAAAAEAARQEAEAKLTAEAEAACAAFQALVQSVVEQLGKPGADGNRAVLVPADAAAGTPERVLLAACKIEFRLGEMSSVLPLLDSDRHLIPDPYLMQIVQRPRATQPRSPILRFRLLTERDPTPEEVVAREAEELAAAAAAAAATKGSKRPVSPKKAAPTPDELAAKAKQGRLFEQGRWTIPANGSVDLVVHFQSEEVGKFLESLVFDVLGGERHNVLTVTGMCGIPQIATDYRCV